MEKLIFVCKYQEQTLGMIFKKILHYVFQMLFKTFSVNHFNVFDPTYFMAVDFFNYCSKMVKEPELVGLMGCLLQCYERNVAQHM